MYELKIQFPSLGSLTAFAAAAAAAAATATTEGVPSAKDSPPVPAPAKGGKGSPAATPAADSASAKKQEPAASPAPAAEPAAAAATPKAIKYEDSGIGPLIAQLVDANRAADAKALLTEYKATDANGKLSAKFLKPEQFDSFKAAVTALLAKKPEDLG